MSLHDICGSKVFYKYGDSSVGSASIAQPTHLDFDGDLNVLSKKWENMGGMLIHRLQKINKRITRCFIFWWFITILIEMIIQVMFVLAKREQIRYMVKKIRLKNL